MFRQHLPLYHQFVWASADSPPPTTTTTHIHAYTLPPHALPPHTPALNPPRTPNRSNCNLLSAGTNIDLFRSPTSARIRAPLPPCHPSLNGDYVQQSSLLSNQRIPQKSHSLVMTPLFTEHVGGGGVLAGLASCGQRVPSRSIDDKGFSAYGAMTGTILYWTVNLILHGF